MSTAVIVVFVLVFILLIILSSCFVTVKQGTIAVITVFGKYRRIMLPGLNFKLPLIENVYSRISIQNRSVELEFQAVTFDQGQCIFQSDAFVFGVKPIRRKYSKRCL